MRQTGKFIRKCREKIGISQVELARNLGCSSQFIANWERGVSNPPGNMLLPLCDFLKIDRKELKKFLLKDAAFKIKRYLGV